MSLQVLAQNMASRGRNGDDMLVHMSRDEVADLQRLAKSRGLTLTINPETGLPEAGKLKNILKAVAPIALGAILGPAGFGMSAFNTALTVGGIGALATGSLKEGFMMGLGAYGGAGIGEGLKTAAIGDMATAPSSTAIVSPEASAANITGGTSAGAGTAPKFAYQAAQATPYDLGTGGFGANVVSPEMFSQVAPATPIPAPAPAIPTTSLDFAGANAKEAAWKSASLGDKTKMAYEAVSKDPMKFAKANVRPGLAALYAGSALSQEEPEMPQGGQNRQGYIRSYDYDPYSGLFTPGTITPTSRYAADGGIMAVGYKGGGIAALAEGGEAEPAAAPEPTKAQENLIANIYQTTLGRDPDPEGLEYWSSRLAAGESPTDVYSALQGSAKYVLGDQAATLAPNITQSYEQAITPYTGFKSADSGNIGDEWIRNVLNRAPTAADTQQGWYQELSQLGEKADVESAYADFVNAYGVGSKAPKSWFEASQLKAPFVPVKTSATTGMRPGYTFDPATTVGSGLVRPEEPAGQTTGYTPGSGTIPTMQDVVNTYTQGGGMTGRLPYVPRSLAEQEQLYNRMTGSSKSAYDYLMGRGEYPIRPVVQGPVALPYGQAVMGLPASTYNTQYIYDPGTKQYITNPNYKPVDLKVPKEPAPGASFAEKIEATSDMADGGLAHGGIYNLGDYSDGGRLLKGPGDGVSDSIPATIANKRPARLADGEFVIPARIVSELGNGSTDAGARKLYEMMDRIQSRRGKTTGKGKVAVNSRADKLLPV